MPRFQKRNTFGEGRPPGSPNKSTVWFDTIGAEGVAKVIQVVKDEAEKGNMRAASIMLTRTWPRRRGRPVLLDLPDVATAGGLVQAHAGVIAAMARGEITPEEAASIGGLLESQRRAIDTYDNARQIEELKDGASDNGGARPLS